MARRQVGTVAALGRYPVKSMLGEEPRELEITERGAAGDRAWALRELATGRIVSAKKFHRLFEFRAGYDSEPVADRAAPITIEMPGGERIRPDDPDASEKIGRVLNVKVRIERAEAAGAERAGIDPATVFADVPVEKVIPGLTLATLPPEFSLRRGTFFDSATMHVLASGTLAHLAKLSPGSVFDWRRFRPTIFVDTDGDAGGFIEDGWLKGTLEVGGGVKIAAMQPALRCVMTTLPQPGFDRDLKIFRTAAEHHRSNVGVFASVTAPGRVRLGDPVFLVE
jgi:MOSC domain-containing protein